MVCLCGALPPLFVRCIVNIDRMSFSQLRQLAEELNIHDWSRLRKAELREAMQEITLPIHPLELEVQH